MIEDGEDRTDLGIIEGCWFWIRSYTIENEYKTIWKVIWTQLCKFIDFKCAIYANEDFKWYYVRKMTANCIWVCDHFLLNMSTFKK